jgi:hypothetical protein
VITVPEDTLLTALPPLVRVMVVVVVAGVWASIGRLMPNMSGATTASKALRLGFSITRCVRLGKKVKRFIGIDSGISLRLPRDCLAGQGRSSDRKSSLPGAVFRIYAFCFPET